MKDASNGMVVESADGLYDYFIIDTLRDGHKPLTLRGDEEPITFDTEEQAYWSARELVRNNLKYDDGVQIIHVKNGKWNPIVEISSPE